MHTSCQLSCRCSGFVAVAAIAVATAGVDAVFVANVDVIVVVTAAVVYIIATATELLSMLLD